MAGKDNSGSYVALLRGINVGKAKRVPMAELRALVAKLGYEDVRTVLNSGNVVFRGPDGEEPAAVVARLESALEEATGVSARVTVLTAAELERVVSQNTLGEIADNPSRLLVGVLADPSDRAELEPLLDEDWGKGAFALGERAAYMWCPDGMLQSALPGAVEKRVGAGITSRNWKTISKLHGLASANG